MSGTLDAELTSSIKAVQANTWYPLSDFLTFSYKAAPPDYYPPGTVLQSAYGSFEAPTSGSNDIFCNLPVLFKAPTSQVLGNGYNVYSFCDPSYPVSTSVNPYELSLSSIQVEFLSTGLTSIADMFSTFASICLQEYNNHVYTDSSGSHTIYSGGFDVVSYNEITVNPADPLFTSGSDNVNFNALSPNQVNAIKSGAPIYSTLSGNDTVVLPDAASVSNLGGSGVAFDLADLFVLGSGSDTLTGGNSNYNIALGAGSDVIALGNGNNNIIGSTGNSTITVGNGNNNLNLSHGINEVVAVGSGVDRVVLGNGTDVAYGGSGFDVLEAGSGTDQLNSASAATTLIGGTGTDTLLAESGNKIEGFHAGDLLGLSASNPNINVANFITYINGNDTKIEVYSPSSLSAVATLTLVGKYTGDFEAATPNAVQGYIEFSYSSSVLSEIFQGIQTVVTDVTQVIDTAEKEAIAFVADYFAHKLAAGIALAIIKKVSMVLPPVAKNIGTFTLDFGIATAELVQGKINGNQYATMIAHALAGWIPFGGQIATLGSALVSKMIDNYFNNLDAVVAKYNGQSAAQITVGASTTNSLNFNTYATHSLDPLQYSFDRAIDLSNKCSGNMRFINPEMLNFRSYSEQVSELTSHDQAAVDLPAGGFTAQDWVCADLAPVTRFGLQALTAGDAYVPSDHTTEALTTSPSTTAAWDKESDGSAHAMLHSTW